MGCEVVSVYNDEVIGKIGLPQTIIQDLFDRDYRQLKPLSKPKQISPKIQHLQGFTQSFAISKLFFTMVKTDEHLVYVAGRFVVIQHMKTKQQRIITNPEFIASFTVVDKLCLVGLIGGTLLLWDLEFLEIKLEILLPEISTNISTVGLTSKYIFATDGSTPNNFVYCYDLRTAKLISSKTIPSLQPAVKSINPTEDLHVIACADGIWITKMHKSSKEIEVIKGMFGTYPKTSMTCLANAGNYLISGGVDGYIYVWRISTSKCCRALKVGDSEIVSIAAKGKHIIFGCLNGRMKVYTFEVKKKEKKEYIIEQIKDEDDEEEVVLIVVDSFLKEGSTIAICASIEDPYLYYCQTKQGVLYQKYLPVPTSERKKVNLKSNVPQNIKKINTTCNMSLSGSSLISAYVISNNIIMIDRYSISDSKLTLEEERTAISKENCQNIVCFSEMSQQIASLTQNNKIQISSTLSIAEEAVSHQNKSDIDHKTQTILELGNQKFVSFNYTSFSQHQYLCATSNQSIWIYHHEAALTYNEKCHLKYENTIPSSITVDQIQFFYDKQRKKWVEKSEHINCLTEQAIKEKQTIHTGEVKSIETVWEKEKMSCGGGFVIFWK